LKGLTRRTVDRTQDPEGWSPGETGGRLVGRTEPSAGSSASVCMKVRRWSK